jgi:hypothetical protein
MILDDAKKYLRVSASQIAFDTEIQDLIDSAKSDLTLSGVLSTNVAEADPLIRRAVFVYVKSHFGWDNPDSDKLTQSYNSLKTHLTLSQEYTHYLVTFTVTDGVNPLEGATITLNNEKKLTNSSGVALFRIRYKKKYDYTVTKEGYQDIESSVEVLDNASFSVTMVVV